MNRSILAIEGLLLGYPSILGVVLGAGAILPLLTGTVTLQFVLDAMAGILIVTGLVAGYRLLFAYVAHGATHARRGKAVWWWIACCMMVLGFVGWVWPHAQLELFKYVVIFAPTFAHLSVSVWRGGAA